MIKLFLVVASLIVAAPLTMAVSSTQANAGLFCATYSDGGSYRSCGFFTYANCLRTISGAGGMCLVNWKFPGSNGYGSGGPAYGATYYGPAPRYYGRSGADIYIGGDID